jgi:drug/metabolite transporter (DMT)-like permease
VSAILFGLNASTTTVVVHAGVPADQLVMIRSAVSALLAGAVLVFTNPKAFKVTLREIPLLIVFGIFGLALMQWAYSNAVSILPVGIALLFEYTAIIIVPIAARVIFKEKTTRAFWFGVALVISGLLVVSQVWAGGLNPTGVFFAFMAAVLLAFYFLMGQHAGLTRDPLSTMFYTMLIASIFWAVLNGGKASPFDLSSVVSLTGNLASVQVPFWVPLAWLTVMGSFAPMAMGFIALKLTTAARVSITQTAEPVFAFIFGWLWLGQSMDWLQAIGGALVVSGIVLAQRIKPLD